MGAGENIITAEERFFWKHYLGMYDVVYLGPQQITLRLLNALEATEAKLRDADADIARLSTDCDNWQEGSRQMSGRAEKAELEREILAEALAWGFGRENRSVFEILPWVDCKRRWLEWAAKEAAKRTGE
ncbi:hypothetical protein LJC36_00060 [Desulfovibrio sp. OttesenSCG-928-C14]|nr:hypothetical protein [Desulfovibrio sp. OttesenSCG-928-C14]